MTHKMWLSWQVCARKERPMYKKQVFVIVFFSHCIWKVWSWPKLILILAFNFVWSPYRSQMFLFLTSSPRPGCCRKKWYKMLVSLLSLEYSGSKFTKIWFEKSYPFWLKNMNKQTIPTPKVNKTLKFFTLLLSSLYFPCNLWL